MESLLARSMASSLKLDVGDDDDDGRDINRVNDLILRRSRNPNSILNRLRRRQQPPPRRHAPPRRTFRSSPKHSRANSGASLPSSPLPLAPPTSDIPSRPSDSSESPFQDDPIAGRRSDFAEIGEKFKSGISKLSSNKAVSEITTIASNFLQFKPPIYERGLVWKIFFVLLHPRLSKTDAVLLSTPQVLETRALMSCELQKQTNARPATNCSNTGAPRSKATADLLREVSLSVSYHDESVSVPVKIFSSELVPPIVVAKTTVNEDLCVAMN